jgi:hypothetical protein
LKGATAAWGKFDESPLIARVLERADRRRATITKWRRGPHGRSRAPGLVLDGRGTGQRLLAGFHAVKSARGLPRFKNVSTFRNRAHCKRRAKWNFETNENHGFFSTFHQFH